MVLALKLILLLVSFSGFVTPFDLTILHTNDVHARFEQTSGTAGGPCTAEQAADGACYGGVARRAAKVKEIRNSVQNVLLVDAGDGFQGTVWFYVFRGQATAYFMNMLGYDAMALGNHEFDIGVDSLLPFLQNVSFPVLSCNMNSSGEPSMTGLYACQTTVALASGDRVGIVGYILVDTPLYTKSGNLIFSPEIDSLQPAVDNLIESGVDAIIALGHSGIDTDIEIAKKVRGIDVVIGGHSNTFMYTGSPPSSELPYSDYPLTVSPDHDPDATVLVASDYAYGKYLGRLDLTFDSDGAVSNFGGNPILLDNSVPQDTETLNAMLRWKETVDVTANQIVGSSLVPLRGNEFCYSTECNMGNVLADAMLAPHINRTVGAWSDVAVAMTTSGSVKANEVQKGDVTVNDLLLNMPYGNTIDVLELRGTNILDVLEHSVRKYEAGGNAGEFLQLCGLRVSYDVSRPIGSRVLTAHVRCANCDVPSYEPLDKETIYKVAMNSYMAGGGYGFSVNENKLSHVKGDLDVDVTSDYLRTYSPIRTGVEGRVTIYNGDAPCYQDPTSGAGMSLKGHTSSLFLVYFIFLALTWVFGGSFNFVWIVWN
ncbi:5'-nucleotidase-like [Patiria miniata]|uniref:5'-nucleotidase n=1 Tax=Patiria miniata TaxID=46514 RepID=A0A914A8S1_PATMI|nr:5'-nucleotidase-like [Patiria miniata]